MRRSALPLTATVCTCVVALVVPALGWASSSGGASGGTGASSGGTSAQPSSNNAQPTGSATPVNGEVSSSAGGMTISTHPVAFMSGQLLFRGRVPTRYAGDAVEIERDGQETGWSWAPTASGTVGSNGSFAVQWHTDQSGRFAVRAVLQRAGEAADTGHWPTVTITVFRSSVATLYGPGFYGHKTACGEVLHRQTLGVANRTLPCGTRIAIYYGGKTITVPVIDRGPYSNGADWDLTEATGRQLGMDSTARIGAVSLPRRS